ncbi:MAG: metal-dependent transcriptional regulator [Anaerolineales bacterium]|jgi:DtxR family Mn-dependent transcriptional regulator|nr:metal-dependent transcriptional regulator [Anaerolineales bacterium]
MRRRSDLSHAIEDYLKGIYELQQGGCTVSTSALARRLGFTSASVTGMLKKLAAQAPQLVKYRRHRGVVLTPTGEKIALEIIRHHRLIELYLMEALGYSWDEVHAEADKLEHVISESFEDRIATFLGDPDVDPHGEPIPTKEGYIADSAGTQLSALRVGQAGRIIRVMDEDPELLRYLTELGLRPSAVVTVTARAPFGGPVHVQADGGETHVFGDLVADSVYVELVPEIQAVAQRVG